MKLFCKRFKGLDGCGWIICISIVAYLCGIKFTLLMHYLIRNYNIIHMKSDKENDILNFFCSHKYH